MKRSIHFLPYFQLSCAELESILFTNHTHVQPAILHPPVPKIKVQILTHIYNPVRGAIARNLDTDCKTVCCYLSKISPINVSISKTQLVLSSQPINLISNKLRYWKEFNKLSTNGATAAQITPFMQSVSQLVCFKW